MVVSPLRVGAKVHIIGIGGAGMSGLARLLVEMGAQVSGSDATESSVLEELRRVGVVVALGHDPRNVEGAEVVLWSPAIGSDNVELVGALTSGAMMLARSEVLAELGSLRRVVGLTGTHGKTTATSMMVHVVQANGADAGRLVGADVVGVGPNGHWANGDLVMEVDESYGTFSMLNPYALGLLNVEADHLDFYGSLGSLEEAFAELVGRTTGPVVIWGDDAGARRVIDRVLRDVVVVGTSGADAWTVSEIEVARGSASFWLRGPGHDFKVVLRVTGLHNVVNAAVVAVLALSIGVAPAAVVDGLALFQGAPRRFQLLGSWRGVDVYEDYAHLPGEVAATLAATRAAGYERITAVFQPHRVTRTVSLAPSFAAAFDDATTVVVTDIYPAGESNPSGVTGELVANAVREHRADDATIYCQYLDGLAQVLGGLHDRSDVLLLLGAGDVALVANDLFGAG